MAPFLFCSLHSDDSSSQDSNEKFRKYKLFDYSKTSSFYFLNWIISMLVVIKMMKLCCNQKLVIWALFPLSLTGRTYLEVLRTVMKLPWHAPQTSQQTMPTSHACVTRLEATARSSVLLIIRKQAMDQHAHQVSTRAIKPSLYTS